MRTLPALRTCLNRGGVEDNAHPLSTAARAALRRRRQWWIHHIRFHLPMRVGLEGRACGLPPAPAPYQDAWRMHHEVVL
jgi:hypothetical protein